MLKHINNNNGGGCSSSYKLHSSDKVRIVGGGCGGGEEAMPGEPDAPCGSFASPAEAITGAARYITHSPKELLVHLEQRLCAGEARPVLAATDHPFIQIRTEKIYSMYMHIISSNSLAHRYIHMMCLQGTQLDEWCMVTQYSGDTYKN